MAGGATDNTIDVEVGITGANDPRLAAAKEAARDF